MARQHTLAQPTRWVEGRELQSGRRVRVCILPAPADYGLRYALGRAGSDGVVLDSIPVPADLDHATNRDRCICVEGNGVAVTNVEHLNAVFVALGLDNALVVLDKPGVWPKLFKRQALPLLDDSTAGFVGALADAGHAEQDATRRERTVSHSYRIEDPKTGDFAGVDPGPGLRVSCTAGYERLGIPAATLHLEITPEGYRDELSRARTLMNQYAQIPAPLLGLGAWFAYPRYGLGCGVSPATMVLMRRGRPVGEARYGGPAEELVRHKIIDFLGALALVGPVNNCHFTVVKSSHRHDLTFMRGLLRRLHEPAAAPAAV